MISMARAKDEWRIVSKLRAKGEEDSKDWCKIIRGDKNEQINMVDELIVNGVTGVSVEDKVTMVNAITEFWEDISGMNETTNVVNYMPELCVEGKTVDGMNAEISCAEIEENLRKLENGKAARFDNIPYELSVYCTYRHCRQNCL